MPHKKRKVMYVRLQRQVKNFLTFLKYLFCFSAVVVVLLLLANRAIFSNFIRKFHRDYDALLNSNACSGVVLEGVNYANGELIKEKVAHYCNCEKHDLLDLTKEIMKDPWIKEIYLKRRLTEGLVITIFEYNPFAIFDDGTKHLMDEYGDVIDVGRGELKKFHNLLVITGDNFKDEIYNLFNFLSIFHTVSSYTVRADRIGNRRWNLILKNGVVLKLPEENKKNLTTVWENAEKLLQIHGLSVGLREIDLRVEDKIFLKYDKDVVEEISNYQQN